MNEEQLGSIKVFMNQLRRRKLKWFPQIVKVSIWSEKLVFVAAFIVYYLHEIHERNKFISLELASLYRQKFAQSIRKFYISIKCENTKE